MRFSLEINFLGETFMLQNLESTDYGYLTLLNDVCGATIGNRTCWLSNMVVVEGVLPDTGDAIILTSDEDIEILIATYLSIGIENVSVNLQITSPNPDPTHIPEERTFASRVGSSRNSRVEFENVLPIEIQQEYDELDGEGPVEVQEIVGWSDTESDEERNAMNEEANDMQAISDSDGETDDNLSDYTSDKDHEIFYYDDDLEVRNLIAVISEKIEGEYFEYKYDNKGKRVIELKENLLFNNVHHFKDVLIEYQIQEGIKVKKVKNDKKRIIVVCNNSKECKWRVHVSTYADEVTFKIKTLKSVHTCVRNLKAGGVSAKWIANEFKEEFMSNLEKPVEELDDALRSKYGLHANFSKLYRARKIAMEMASGDHAQSYANIPRYIEALKMSNPGTIVKLKCDGLDITNPECKPVFQRLFISFEAQYQGFVKGCRPFIGVDGCFLKGPFKGELFFAVALDSNFGIFPIAVMICETESEDSWRYFFDCLREHLPDEINITFMSDRQKGLKKAIKYVFPNLRERSCAVHLFKNLQGKYPGPDLRKWFWIAVNSYSEDNFNEAMEKIKAIDDKAYTWLTVDCKEHPSTWSRHGFDENSKVNHVTNNMTKSFNSFLLKMRRRPVLRLLQWYRSKLMKRFFKRYQKALTWETRLTPNMNKVLETNQRDGRKLLVVPSTELLFEVHDNKKYIVNLKEMTCQCREWQVSGVLCKHAMSCILYMRYDPVEYVDPYLTKDAYLRTYEGMTNVVPDESMWPDPKKIKILPLQPPEHKKKKRVFKQGRLQINRMRGKNEPPKAQKRSVHVTCQSCHEPGHNKRTCTRKNSSSATCQRSSISIGDQANNSQTSSLEQNTHEIRSQQLRGGSQSKGKSRKGSQPRMMHSGGRSAV